MAKAGHTRKAKIKQVFTNGIYFNGAGKVPKKTIAEWNNG